MSPGKTLSVETLFRENQQELKLKLLNAETGLKNTIREYDLCRPGLLLAGFTGVFAEKKIQILGKTEISYLKSLDAGGRNAAFTRLMDQHIPCLVIANKSRVDKALLDIADRAGICIFQSPSPTIHIFQVLFEYLNENFAPSTAVHGTLVDVYGVGILLTGRSGIGKSEIALDLVERGHRLVADDVVNISRKRAGILIGTSREILKSIIEIRGVGLIDVRATFGVRASRIQKYVEVEVRLEDHKKIEGYDRLGIDEEFTEYLGVKIPLIHLPIFPGKNITVIAEVIALKILQKVIGIRPELDFVRKLDNKIKQNHTIRKHVSRDLE